MKKIGIFLDEIKDQTIDDTQKFSKLGSNTGNMLFWHSLKAQLKLDVRSRWYIDHIEKLNLSEYKAFITTDLIWIRQMQDLSYINKVLDVIGDLPLIPISIGLQCNSYLPDFKMHPETVKLIQRLSERCTMGVRGSYTAEILDKYGIKNFKVVGCPSMYLGTVGIDTVGAPTKPINNVSVNFETFYSKLSPAKIDFLLYCAEYGYEFVEQTQVSVDGRHIPDEEKLRQIEGWLSAKKHCFFDIAQWREYMRKFDFSMGTRFHGNVLALWENVPALFLTCDSRTRELCEHFSLPMLDINAFDSSKPIEHYYETADYERFHKQYPQRLREWEEFLEMNGIGEEVEMDKTENQSTVLYQVGHFGSLINCMLHKQYYHPNSEAIFLIDKVILNKLTLQNFMQRQGNFSFLGEFYYYSDREIISSLNTDADAEQVIENYFDKFLQDNGVALEKISEIYSVFDTYNAFGVYLCLKKTEFNMIEPVPNALKILSRYNLNKDVTPIYDETISKYKALSAHCNYCKRLYSYDGTVFNNKETIINNSPAALLDKLSDDKISKIVNAYNIKYDTAKDYTLFILNSGWFVGANGLKYPNGYFYLLHKVKDIYLKNKQLLIKPHPNTEFTLEKWNEEFPNADVIPAFFPSFLVPYLPDLHLSQMLSTGSSGAMGINVAHKQIPFLFFSSYQLINKLYVLISLSKYLNVPKEKFFHYGIHNKVIWSLSEELYGHEFSSTWSQLEFNENSFTIIDNIFWNPGDFANSLKNQMRLINNNAVIAFVNSNKDFIFMDENEEFIRDLYEMRITKTGQKDNCCEKLNDEVIYIFCKDHNKIVELQKFSLFERFDSQGYSIIVKGMEEDKRINDLSIKVDYLLSKKS